MTKTVRATVRGRVQGVGYRYWCQRQATALGLSGWVRNLRTGEVEALLDGNDEAVDEMIRLLREGPLGSRVDAVDITEDDAMPCGEFAVRPTVDESGSGEPDFLD